MEGQLLPQVNYSTFFTIYHFFYKTNKRKNREMISSKKKKKLKLQLVNSLFYLSINDCWRQSGRARLIAFGSIAENLTITRQTLIGQTNRYILPEPIKKKVIGLATKPSSLSLQWKQKMTTTNFTFKVKTCRFP